MHSRAWHAVTGTPTSKGQPCKVGNCVAAGRCSLLVTSSWRWLRMHVHQHDSHAHRQAHWNCNLFCSRPVARTEKQGPCNISTLMFQRLIHLSCERASGALGYRCAAAARRSRVGWLLHSHGTCIGRSSAASMKHATGEQPWIRPGRAQGTAKHHAVW